MGWIGAFCPTCSGGWVLGLNGEDGYKSVSTANFAVLVNGSP